MEGDSSTDSNQDHVGVLRDLEIEVFSSSSQEDLDIQTCQDIFRDLEDVYSKNKRDEKVTLESIKESRERLKYQTSVLEDRKRKANEDQKNLAQIESEAKSAQDKNENAKKANLIIQYELQRVKPHHDDLKKQADDMKTLNNDIVQPVIAKRELELDVAREEALKATKALEKAKALHDELTLNVTDLQSSCDGTEKIVQEKKAYELELRMEPVEIQNSIESTKKEVVNIDEELSGLDNQIASARLKALDENAQSNKVKDARMDAEKKLENQKKKYNSRNKEYESVAKALAAAQAQYHSLTTTRLEIEIKLRDVKDNLRHQSAATLLQRKQLDRLMRLYIKKKSIASRSNEIVDRLKNQLVEQEDMVKYKENECDQRNKIIDKMKDDKNIKVTQLLEQRDIEDEMKVDLEAVLHKVDEKEEEIDRWRIETKKLTKIISILRNQLEIQMQRSRRVNSDEKETLEALKFKKYTVIDMKKTLHETNKRVGEFNALHESLKKKKNDVETAISASTAGMIDIRAKISSCSALLQELRNSHDEKSGVLGKEKDAHGSSKASMATLRVECKKVRAMYRDKQERLERQEGSIEKLKTMLGNIRRSTLQLKSRNKRLSSRSKKMADQLDDKRADLHSLLQRANLYEETLKRGELAIQQKKEEMRVIQIQCNDLERHINAKKSIKTDIKDYEEKIKHLEDELENEARQIEKLSTYLENPSECRTYRDLGGEDMDKQQIEAKTKILLQRLSDSKEQLLEREVTIEELCTGIDQLEREIELERIKTQPAVKKLNDYQGRIREVTRSMMALVSELSMYQATALKLEDERGKKEEELTYQRTMVSSGRPPSDVAVLEFQRSERRQSKQSQHIDKLDPQAQVNEFGRVYYPANYALRTSAEPRPTAYIPDVGLEIPKPYGAMAPFKPCDSDTSSMRHIRPPAKKEIYST